MLSVGSLFSGIGGIELGLEQTGFFKTIWCIEKDEYAQIVLRKRFPHALLHPDITKVDFTAVPKVDVLAGGFPCQDISIAGRRFGITGRRSALWKYFHRAIGILRPKYVLIENVAALTNRGLSTVLSDLAENGYDAEWCNLSASAVGAFHRRERIFIIAYPAGSRRQQTSAQNSHVANTHHLGQSRRKKIRVRQAILRSSEHTWATEPRLDRVAHGIPYRLDRIRCLGNAVVPACAEVIGQTIQQFETKNRNSHQTPEEKRSKPLQATPGNRSFKFIVPKFHRKMKGIS